MRRLTAEQVHAQKMTELGLDPESLDLNTPEGLAGALRRVASYLCPCSPGSLVRAVVRPLRGLVQDLDAAQALVDQTLDAMVAHGDLLELPETHGTASSSRVLLYAAPVTFVVRQSGLVILLGVCADHLSPLPDELERRIEFVGHLRRLRPLPGEDLRRDLRQLGLRELAFERWLTAPSPRSAESLVALLDDALDRIAPSRDIPGLLLLDSERDVRFYRGRWVSPKHQTGRYVARRSQAYGADLWCYVQVRDGQPERMIDLPLGGDRWRGCDEAWRLQMAIDSQRGVPQRFGVIHGRGDATILELFSPVPAWARRRWDAIGEPVPSTRRLFAYRIPKTELDEERRFARDSLWLEENNAISIERQD